MPYSKERSDEESRREEILRSALRDLAGHCRWLLSALPLLEWDTLRFI